MSWQRAVGSTVSSMVTSASQVETLPFASVTVRVTVTTPTSEQSKSCEVFPPSIVIVVAPQLSEEPLSISAAKMVKSPLASS